MSHYETLGVLRSATPAEIEAAFRERVRSHNSRLLNLGPARAAPFAKQVANPYRTLRDPKRRKEYDEYLDRLQSPAENQAISDEEFQSWVKEGRVLEGLTAKIKWDELRREGAKTERMNEPLNNSTFDNVMYGTATLFAPLLIICLGIGAVWLLVTAIRYFWTHPLF